MTSNHGTDAADRPDALPAGSVDCHVHVFDPQRHPFAAGRSYTPAPALANDLRAVQDALGISRTVVVQASVQGTRTAALCDALAALGSERARGVSVVDHDDSGPSKLDHLQACGVRGLRLNLAVNGQTDVTAIDRALRAQAALADRPGWHLQLHLDSVLLPWLAETLPHLPGRLVLDHFGGLHADARRDPPAAADALHRLLDNGRVHLKLSAFYRASAAAPDHADLDALATTLLQRHPQRLVWGSDWPHTGGGHGPRDPAAIEPFRTVDLPASLRALRRWCGDAATLQQVLVDNPQALYGFAAVAGARTAP